MDTATQRADTGESRPEQTDRPFDQDLELYHREAARLLAEGHEGRWALIKKRIIGVFETEEEALAAGYRLPCKDIEPFLVQRVQASLGSFDSTHFRWGCPPVESPPPGRTGATRTTIHYTELGPAAPGCAIDQEWKLYRREVGRLLAEGHEGKFVLIKGEQIIGFFNTSRTAMDEGYKRYLLQGFLVQQIRAREPVHRVSSYLRSCPAPR